jgi:hypothetical protein
MLVDASTPTSEEVSETSDYLAGYRSFSLSIKTSKEIS